MTESAGARLRKACPAHAVFFLPVVVASPPRPPNSIRSNTTSILYKPESVDAVSASRSSRVSPQHVTRWYYSLCHWLRPRHARPRPCLRVRTVCLLTPRPDPDRRRPRRRSSPSIEPVYHSPRRTALRNRSSRDESFVSSFPRRPDASRLSISSSLLVPSAPAYLSSRL